MKKNFYLQHPLMAMNDPRMKKLVADDNLRGSGGYWFIIEKLSLLPEPYAQMEYLQPFCKVHKISFSYLKKIILGYELFSIDKDGYFTPLPLNVSPAKKEEKTDKKQQKTAENKAKNAENEQKTGKNDAKIEEKTAEIEAQKTGNTLKSSILPQNSIQNSDDNINNIITTSTTTEEDKAEAAGAVIPIESWHRLVDRLPEESSWLDIACMQSGYGVLLKKHISEAVEVFRQHVTLYDNGRELLTMKDVHQYFVNFVRAGRRTSQELRVTLLAIDTRQQAENPAPNPYRHEQLIGGRRTYLGCTIPDSAPPRPDETAFWSDETHSWLSQKTPQKRTSQQRPGQKPN